MSYKPKVLEVAAGGTGDSTLTDHGVLIGRGTGPVEVTAAGSSGQVLQSAGASSNPVYSTATYPSTAGTSGNVITSNGTNFVSQALPAAPGTTLTNHSVALGTGTANLSSVGPSATSGAILQSAGSSSDPAFSTAAYPTTATGTGTILRADGTNWVATTAAYPSTATGTGTLLRADGTNWVPTTATYPATATGTGKILRADGTNWVASTATYPDTAGTSGNVLTSNGTNFVSSAPVIQRVSVDLTNAQVKALRATPIQMVAGQGAGTIVIPTYAVVQLIYGGTNAFTVVSASVTFTVTNATTYVVLNTINNNYLATTANTFGEYAPYAIGFPTNGIPVATWDNAAIFFTNVGAAEIAGNAANNNTVRATLFYQVLTY